MSINPSDALRDMWSAVVLQALADVDYERIGSIDYEDAVSFFTANGTWRRSREAIADQLGLHEDELRAVGSKHITARRLKEGLPAVAAPPAAPTPKAPPEPLIYVNEFAPRWLVEKHARDRLERQARRAMVTS